MLFQQPAVFNDSSFILSLSVRVSSSCISLSSFSIVEPSSSFLALPLRYPRLSPSIVSESDELVIIANSFCKFINGEEILEEFFALIAEILIQNLMN